MTANIDSILCIGRIQGPKGVKGEVRITAFGELLGTVKKFSFELYTSKGPIDGFLLEPQKKQAYNFYNIRAYKENIFLANIEGINSPEAVDGLKGLYLGLSLQTAKRDFASDNEPYMFEFLGLAVVDAEEPAIKGQVAAIREYEGRGWLVAEIDGREILIPLVAEYVDMSTVVDPLPIKGLKFLLEA